MSDLSLEPTTIGALAASALALGLLLAAPAMAQRGTADPCAPVISATEEARSLKELRERITRSRIPESTLRSCAGQLEANANYRRLVSTEEQSFKARAVQVLATENRSRTRAPEQLSVNQRVVTARSQAYNRRSFLEAQAPTTKSTSPSGTRSLVTTPAINQVTPSPVVPGTDLVIEGSDFGTTTGTVRLKLQGKTFSAQINAWNDTWISAFLPDTVSGVTESTGAVLEVVPSQGQPINRTVQFVPIYERRVVNDLWMGAAQFSPLPVTVSATLFENWILSNGWRVAAAPWTTASGGIQCDINGPPVPAVGDTNMATQVLMAKGWFQTLSCFAMAEIEGPRGLSHGLW